MKTYEQLMKHYWGVIVPMAEAAGIKPWECVKHDNDTQVGNHPRFILKPYERYTFALTVLEGKPVFIGDKVYNKITSDWHVIKEIGNPCLSCFTWTPPTKKRTFMLNENELNCPISDTNGCRLDFLGVDYYFKSMHDRNKVASAINSMLHAARDKE